MVNIEDKIKAIALKNGASLAGISDALKSDNSINLEALLRNTPVNLNYLKSNIEKRLDIKKWYPQARSVLLCAWQYWNSSMEYEKAISSIFAKKGDDIIQLNLRALKAGRDYAEERT